MKKTTKKIKTILFAGTLLLGANILKSQSIIDYDFNSGTSYSTLSPSLATNVTCTVSSSETFNTYAGTASGSSAFTTNSTAGNAIAFSNSSGSTRYWEFSLGGSDLNIYSAYKLYVEAERSSTGAQTITLSYSTDGTTFTNFGTTMSPGNGSFSQQVFDLSSISALNNQTAVYFKLTASGASGSGTLRIDNFEVKASSTQNTFYFKTVASGNFSNASIWEASADGSTNWNAALAPPNYRSSGIVISSGDSVVFNATDTLDQTTVNGILNYGTGCTLKLNNGSGVDLVIGNSAKFYDNGDNAIVWNSATWTLGNSAYLIRTRSTSSDNFRDQYDGGTVNIPASSYWIARKNGSDSPTLSTVGGMYYGNLSVENNTGTTWVTSNVTSFTGSTNFPTIKGNFNIGGSGTGNVSFMDTCTNATPMLVQGNLTIKSGSTFRSHGTGIAVQGNLALYGTFDYGTSSSYLLLNGSNNQTITGTSISLKTVTINKAIAAETVTLNSPVSITGVLTFSTGIMVTDTVNLLTFNAGSTASGVNNDSSFVSGPVKKIGNTAFTFPLGKGNNAQIISITSPANTTDAFQAEFFNTDPTAIYGSTTASTFNYVSTCQYFKLLRKNGTSNIQPTLSYDLTSCIMYMVPDPRVTSFNGTEWVDLGESNFLYSNFGGTISTATTITQYGAITLGNNTTTPFNPLDTTFQLANAGACGAIFMSEYVEDTLGNCAIELYNPTTHTINLSHYYISATQNSSISYPPLQYALTGTVAPFHTFVIVNSEAPSSTLRSKANQLVKGFNFNGKNAIMLEYSTNIGVLLDKIGDYAIPFTDSGWVVGTGSTRNHDLVRLKSIGQGNVNWSSAQYEWLSYPMDTYTNLDWDSSVCAPLKDPDLVLSLGNGNTSCSSPSAFQFDIMATSFPSTIFSYCDVHITYDTAVYGSNIASIVTLSQGGSFQSGDGYNPPSVSDAAYNVLDVRFGNSSSPVSPGTSLSDSYAMSLLTVSIPIRSCQTSNISFTDTSSTSTYYTYQDSSGTPMPDSSFNGTYTVHSYVCGSYCCGGYDTLGNCISYCDTYCYDSTANYNHFDTTIYTYTNQYAHYTNTYYSGGSTITSIVCPINIGSINGTLDPNGALAGTSDIVTIDGQGFGNVIGEVYVTDANQGMANIPLDEIPDIISWTDNEIKVKLPSVLFSTDSTLTPGSGPINVANSCYNQDNSTLTVYYNIINTYITSTNRKLRSNIVKEANSPGSYYFRCDTSISHNDSAYAAVKAAIRHWNCVTGVNWIVGPPDSLPNNNIVNGICDIYFTSTGFSSSTTLANTRNHYPCGLNSEAYAYDADMGILQNISGYVWNYDTVSGHTIPSNAYSFYAVVLHELGHVHLLGHVNDINDLMYRYSFHGGAIKDITTWPSSDQAAAHNAIDSSSSVYIGSCGYSQMIPILSPGCSSLGIETITALVGQLNVFPNPADGDVTINYQLNTNTQVNFKLMDYLGREVLAVKSGERTEGTNNEKLNIANLASGIYLLVANINGSSQTVRIVKP